jgi:hypothetical protein
MPPTRTPSTSPTCPWVSRPVLASHNHACRFSFFPARPPPLLPQGAAGRGSRRGGALPAPSNPPAPPLGPRALRPPKAPIACCPAPTLALRASSPPPPAPQAPTWWPTPRSRAPWPTPTSSCSARPTRCAPGFFAGCRGTAPAAGAEAPAAARAPAALARVPPAAPSHPRGSTGSNPTPSHSTPPPLSSCAASASS